MLAVSHWP